jgi:hypothetical protein
MTKIRGLALCFTAVVMKVAAAADTCGPAASREGCPTGENVV